MDDENEQECGVNEQDVDCLDAFNTSQWARSVAHENGFVAMIMRSDTNTGIRGKTSFVLIDCEMSGQYRSRKKDFVRRDAITAEFERVYYAGKNPSCCGCVRMVFLVHHPTRFNPYVLEETKFFRPRFI
ncbi:hypothetical protein HKD37_04G011180 [Glycine soja]